MVYRFSLVDEVVRGISIRQSKLDEGRLHGIKFRTRLRLPLFGRLFGNHCLFIRLTGACVVTKIFHYWSPVLIN